MTTRVHPTAVVDRSSELGAGVEVGAYSVVCAGAVIGDGCVLHNHVTVFPGVRMGRGNTVSPWAVLGADPQDLKYRGGPTTLIIGDHNKIREHVTIHRGTEDGGGATRVGSRCLVMVGAHVAHDCILEDEVVIANGTMLGGHCLVEFGAGIGGGAGVHHFTTVGTLSFVAGMARVTRDVPPFVVVEGQPAEPRRVNTTALNRRRWTPGAIEAMKDAYRSLFDDHTPTSEQVALLRSRADITPEIERLCLAVERMDKGIFGRYRESLRAGR